MSITKIPSWRALCANSAKALICGQHTTIQFRSPKAMDMDKAELLAEQLTGNLVYAIKQMDDPDSLTLYIMPDELTEQALGTMGVAEVTLVDEEVPA